MFKSVSHIPIMHDVLHKRSAWMADLLPLLFLLFYILGLIAIHLPLLCRPVIIRISSFGWRPVEHNTELNPEFI